MYTLASSLQKRAVLPTGTTRRMPALPRAGRYDEQDRRSQKAGQEIGRNLQDQIEGVADRNFNKIPVPEMEQPHIMDPENRNQLVTGFGTMSELSNSRLAMLGFVAAIVSEFYTGRSVWQQLTFHPAAPWVVLATFVTFIVATFIPAQRGAKLRPSGMWTPWAEVTNGRAAMVGFVALLLTEYFKGGPLIGA